MQSFFNELITGLKSYGKAHQMMRKDGMWKYLLAPGIVHLLLLILTILYAWRVSDGMVESVFAWLNLEEAEGWLSYLKGVLKWVVMFSIRMFMIVAYLAIYKYVVLILLAPLFAYLSEVTEEKLTGNKYPFNMARFIKNVLRGVLIALRNLVFELFWILLLFLFAFIPVIGLISPILLIVIESYFFGFSMMDYYMERKKLKMKESVRYIQRHRGLAVSNGLLYYGLFAIPIVGWIFAPIYAVIAATIAVHESEAKALDIPKE